MLGASIITVILMILLVPATLAWWKIADHWADNEHRRYKPTPRPQGPRVISTQRDSDSGTQFTTTPHHAAPSPPTGEG